MASTVYQKLKIKEGDTIEVLNKPSGYQQSLGTLPRGAGILSKPGPASQVHWFVTDSRQLAKELKPVLKKLRAGNMLWIFFPKGSSNIQTDLSRDAGWEVLMEHTELHWLSMISFDATWTAFALRLKTEKDAKKEAAPKKREIFDYIDPEKKLVRLPDDFAAALKKNKKAEALFQALSYSNRKEYVEWIISAKRAETRSERLSGAVERLLKGWKNPSNR